MLLEGEQQQLFENNRIIEKIDEEEKMMKKKYGFLPLSIWHFAKSKTLQRYVNDEIAKGSYAENKNISQFNPIIAEKILKIWSKEDDKILDPFSGRCRALIAQHLNRQYVGFEISAKAYSKMIEKIESQKLIEFRYKPQIHNMDSRLISYFEEFDLVFSCPPYWDVEDYNKLYGENVVGQLSSINSYRAFLVDYKEIINKCFLALKQGGFAVWVVSDIRRNKALIPFAADTIKIFQSVGFVLHDVVINRLNSLAVMGVGCALENKYTPKVHEYILVFKKQSVL